jgi:ribose transport system substrate-binding protein
MPARATDRGESSTMNGRRVLAVALAAALTLVAAACGDDDDDDASTASDGGSSASADTTAGSDATAGSETTSAPGSDTTAAGGASDTTAADGGGEGDPAALVDGYLERPTEIPVVEPIDGTVPEGMRIAGFVCPLPACQELAGTASTAAEALGWEYVEIPSGFSPEEITTAWEQALREEPDAILTLSTNRAFFQSQLDEAESAGIPVLTMLVDEEPSNGIDGVIYGPGFMERIGTEMADWVAVDSGGAANTVLIYPAQIGILLQQADAFEAEYTAVCPDCGLDRLEVPATSIGSDLPDRITGYLRAHPDVDYAWVGYGDMLLGLPAAMTAAGIDGVSVFSNGGSLAADAAEYLRAGDHVQMFYFYAGTEVMWRAMDWFARTFAGVPTEASTDGPESPWIVTPESAPEGGTANLVEGYAEQYQALWGVG